MLKVAISKDAFRVLDRLPANTSALIRTKIVQYARRPKSLANNVKRLKGTNYLRPRVGDWRVIFEVVRDTMTVLAIGHRGAIYDD